MYRYARSAILTFKFQGLTWYFFILIAMFVQEYKVSCHLSHFCPFSLPSFRDNKYEKIKTSIGG